MKKHYLLYLFALLLSNGVFATTRYWVGTTGNYSDGLNWNTASNGSGASGAPINTDDIVIDRNATITIDGTYSPSSLWIINNAIVNFTNAATSKTYTIGGGSVSPAFKIESGSTLNIQGTAAITLQMFTGACEIYGTMDYSGTSSKMNYVNGGTTTIKTGGKIRYGGTSSNGTGSVATLFMESGSTYEIYKNGGSFPTGTYDPNSLLLNTGAVANPSVFNMASSTGSYGNYEFNSPSCVNSTVGFNQNITLNNLTITDDGSGKWVFSTSPTTAYTLTINGNLSTAAGTTIDINRAASGSQVTTLLVKGNITNNGLITETNGNTGATIEIGGNSSSTISSTAAGFTNDISLNMNKSAGSLTALTDINLPNSANAILTLTSGNIDMSANNKILFIQNPAAAACVTGSVASHIIGKLKRSSNQAAAYSFPVSNNAGQIAKATITTSNTNATDWLAEFFLTNPNGTTGLTPGVIDVVTKYYWDISRTGATPSDANFLTLYYSGLTSTGVLIPAQVKVVHWNGATWTNLGGTNGGGNVTNTLGSTGAAAPGDPITTFSPFALGGASGVIPINIEYFKGTRSGTIHKLSWKVDCFNSPYVTLTLERSADSRNFSELKVLHADATRCLQSFEETDLSPLAGINYYRLKMTDADGQISYSKIVGLLNKSAGYLLMSVSPNPVPSTENAVLNISSTQKDKLQISITDATGKIVQTMDAAIEAGSTQVKLNTRFLPAGTYTIMTLTSLGDKAIYRFIKD